MQAGYRAEISESEAPWGKTRIEGKTGKGVWVYETVCDWRDKSAGEVSGMYWGEG